MRCIVYFNRPDRYAAIHKATCSYPQMHGGVSAATPETGWYSPVLPSFEAAQVEAKMMESFKVILCGHCEPHGE